LHNQKPATRANAKLSQATYPASMSGNFCDLSYFTGSQHIQGH
jgi:hypothetical protein